MNEIKEQLTNLWRADLLPSGVLLAGENYESLINTAEELALQILNVSNIKTSPDFLHLDLTSVENTRDLLSFISLKSFGNRVVILGHAENLNPSSVNALLKTLEEPKVNTYFIVLTAAEQALLPTLRSRLMVFRETGDTATNQSLAEKFFQARSRTERVLAVQTLEEGSEHTFLSSVYKHAIQNLSSDSSHRPKLILDAFQYLNNNVPPNRALALLAIKW